MPRHREPGAKPYYLSWNVSAAPTAEPEPVEVDQATPVGWIADEHAPAGQVPEDEPEDAAESAPESLQSVLVEALQSDEKGLASFRSSPKSKRGSGLGGALLSNRPRVASLAGWSALAAGGAVLIAAGPAGAMASRLAELGGVWALVAAVVLFLTRRKG